MKGQPYYKQWIIIIIIIIIWLLMSHLYSDQSFTEE